MEAITAPAEGWDWIEQVAGSDPRTKMLLALMRAQQRNVELEPAVRDDLAPRLARVAAALGACRLCWGDDHDCVSCQGRGQPGWCEPEPALFAELVLPAVHAVRRQSGPRYAAPSIHSLSRKE